MDVDDGGERQAVGIGNILTVGNRRSYVDLVRFLIVMRGLDDASVSFEHNCSADGRRTILDTFSMT